MKQRYNVTLNPAVVARIDRYAEANEMSRSDIINQLLFDFIYDKSVPDLSDPELDGQIEIAEVTES